MIVNNVGRILKQATAECETAVADNIPVALFRKTHSIPPLRQELYLPEYTQYQGKYPPNLYVAYKPKDDTDAVDYACRKARW